MHDDPMIAPRYVRTMSAYNSEMNRRLYAAAGRLSDAQRRADGGAFFGSIHGTLCHLLWADRMWMSRFDGWEKPKVANRDSPTLIEAFDTLQAERAAADSAIEAWAASLGPDWLEGRLAWFSGAAGRDVEARRADVVVHFFNHQTHHRGQVHALLTRAGEKTGDTDLWMVLPSLI